MRKEYEWVIQPEHRTVFFRNNYKLSRKFEKNVDNSVIFRFWNDNKDEIKFKINMIPSVLAEYPEPIFDDEAGLWGYRNKIGKLVIPCIYSDCSFFNSDDLAIVFTHNGKVKIIDSKHNGTNEYCIVNDIEEEHLIDTVIGVKDESGQWGIIDAKRDRPPGRQYLVKPQFEYVFKCCGGYAAVKYNGKWGLIRINFSKY